MASARRRRSVHLIDALFEEPYRFEFQQAVRLLELLDPLHREVGDAEHSADEAVRFRSSVSFSFPPTEGISRIEAAAQEGEAPVVTVDFMGMASPASFGSLPVHYAESVLGQSAIKNDALRDFLDVFNHRLISLFYRAWKKYNPAALYRAAGQNAFERAILCFLGLGTPRLEDRLPVADRALIARAGLIAGGNVSASALQGLLRSYFRVDARVEQFVGCWTAIASEDRALLGRRNVRLGRDVFVGSRIQLSQTRFRVTLGPMRWDLYRDLLPLPGSRGHAALVSLVRFAASHEQAFDFVLALERDEVPEPRLARRQPHVDAPRESAAGRLGWSVWLKSRPLARDPADAVIRSRPSVLPAAHEPALAGRGRGELDGAEGIPIGG